MRTCCSTKASEQGFVTYDDILVAFPEAEENLEELEDILATLIEAGVEVGTPEEEEEEEPRSSQAAIPFEIPVEDQSYFETIEIDDTIGLYLKEIGRVPLLLAEEEVALAKRMEAGRAAQDRLRQNGVSSLRDRLELQNLIEDGVAAREHLIRANSRLVISVAKKYIGRGVPFLDLIQEGNIGLDPRRREVQLDQLGHQFSTYATWWNSPGGDAGDS